MPTTTQRKASLGVNFDLGDFGAVVVYSDNEEYPVAFLPDLAAVTAEQAYALAAQYKSRGSKVLTTKQTGRMLGVGSKKKKPVSKYNLPYAE